MIKFQKIGLGGGCHWCTEAVFQALRGVITVKQGYICSIEPNDSQSEAVLVFFDESVISLKTVIKVHLNTHNSTSDHSFRKKYRSAIYTFSEVQKRKTSNILNTMQKIKSELIITKVLDFKKFYPSREEIQSYYLKNPDAPFCKRYIEPKLKKISII